jgi:hypothetical protein
VSDNYLWFRNEEFLKLFSFLSHFNGNVNFKIQISIDGAENSQYSKNAPSSQFFYAKKKSQALPSRLLSMCGAFEIRV